MGTGETASIQMLMRLRQQGLALVLPTGAVVAVQRQRRDGWFAGAAMAGSPRPLLPAEDDVGDLAHHGQVLHPALGDVLQ